MGRLVGALAIVVADVGERDGDGVLAVELWGQIVVAGDEAVLLPIVVAVAIEDAGRTVAAVQGPLAERVGVDAVAQHVAVRHEHDPRLSVLGCD